MLVQPHHTECDEWSLDSARDDIEGMRCTYYVGASPPDMIDSMYGDNSEVVALFEIRYHRGERSNDEEVHSHDYILDKPIDPSQVSLFTR